MKGLPVALYIPGEQNSLTEIKSINFQSDIQKRPIVIFQKGGYTQSLELDNPGEWKFVYDTGLVDIFGKKIFTNSVCAQVWKTEDNLGWEYSDTDDDGKPFDCYVDIESQPNPSVYDLESGDWLHAIDDEDNNLSFDFNGQRRQLLIQRTGYSLSERYYNKYKAVYDTLKLV